MRWICRRAVAGTWVAIVLYSSAVQAAPIVTNGDFETGANTFTAYPGYVGDPGNPAAIPGWSNGGVGRVGVNPGSGTGTPFRDNGNDSTNVAFMQANPSPTTLSQSISGFSPGATYALTFNYNARGCCGGENPNLTTSIGSKTTQIDNIQPVGGSNPYYSVTIPFTATAANQTLLLTTTNHGGDATSLVDNFSLQQVAQVPIVNPSFEANGNGGVGYGPITGWNAVGSWGTNPGGSGNFFIPGRGLPNAAPPDGAQVAFTQGAGALSQTINGLIVGKSYTLTLFDGHRIDDSGGPGDTLTTSIGGVTLGIDTPGRNQYTPLTYTFLATATSEILAFTHGNITGDQSIAIDDVAIFTAAPEPSSLVLLGLGVVGLFAVARRRRKT